MHFFLGIGRKVLCPQLVLRALHGLIRKLSGYEAELQPSTQSKGFFFSLSTSFCLTEFETCHLTQYWSHHTHKVMMGRPSSLQKCYTLSVSWLALPNLPSLCSECPHHKVQFVPDFKCTWLCESYVCGLHHLSVGKPLGHLWNCFLFVFFESAPGWEKANTLVSKKKGSTLRMTWAWQTVFTKRASVHTNLSQCTLLMSTNPGVPALLETPYQPAPESLGCSDVRDVKESPLRNKIQTG